ncbi:MAG: hypothetical protein ACRDRK_23890 [Pseudonocardia sp.]
MNLTPRWPGHANDTGGAAVRQAHHPGSDPTNDPVQLMLGESGAGMSTAAEPIQRYTRLMRWVGAASAAVSAGATVQLLVLPTRTADFFSWTIAVPASAAFLGMFYLASMVMGILALRQPAWAPARAAVVPVVIFAVAALIVTLLHLETFHLTTGGFLARAAAWIWLGVYVVTPPAYLFAFWRQRRMSGGDPARTTPLPRWVWWTLAPLGTTLAVAGLALLVAPPVVAPLWPWPLTALTAQMIGATLLGVALLAAAVVRVDDRPTGRIAALGLVVCAVAALVVAVGYGAGTTQWSEPSAWIYLAVCVLLGTTAFAGVGARPPS